MDKRLEELLEALDHVPLIILQERPRTGDSKKFVTTDALLNFGLLPHAGDSHVYAAMGPTRTDIALSVHYIQAWIRGKNKFINIPEWKTIRGITNIYFEHNDTKYSIEMHTFAETLPPNIDYKEINPQDYRALAKGRV